MDLDPVVVTTIAFVIALLAYFSYNLYRIKQRIEAVIKRGKLPPESKRDLDYVLRVIRRL